MKAISREILLGFWRAHILHHAGEEPLHGHRMLTELRRHSYEISPGTLHPLLPSAWRGSAGSRRGQLRAAANASR